MAGIVGGGSGILVAALRAPLLLATTERRRLSTAQMTTEDLAAFVALWRLRMRVEEDAWWGRPPADVSALDHTLSHWPLEAHRLVWDLAQDVHAQLVDASLRRLGHSPDALATAARTADDTSRLTTTIIVATRLPATTRIRFRARPRRFMRRASERR